MADENNMRLKKVECDLHELRGDVSDLKIRVAVAESHITEIKDDLGSIKGHTTWLLRLVAGAIIGGILTFILNGGLTLN